MANATARIVPKNKTATRKIAATKFSKGTRRNVAKAKRASRG